MKTYQKFKNLRRGKQHHYNKSFFCQKFEISCLKFVYILCMFLFKNNFRIPKPHYWILNWPEDSSELFYRVFWYLFIFQHWSFFIWFLLIFIFLNRYLCLRHSSYLFNYNKVLFIYAIYCSYPIKIRRSTN